MPRSTGSSTGLGCERVFIGMGQLQNAPVVEVALGVQFVTLPGMKSGHYGRFWSDHLDPVEWAETNDAPPVPEQFELFHTRLVWGQPEVKLMLTDMGAPRCMFRTADAERVIQIQPDRFLYNWQRQARGYPSYDDVRAGFDQYFARFQQFVRDRRLGELLLNQWEVIYINRIPPGPLWGRPADWHRVLHGLIAPSPAPYTLEGVNGEWHYELPDRKGRIHLAVRQGLPGKPTGEPPIMTQTTVRGPIGDSGAADWQSGFDLGHSAANQLFKAVMSPEALEMWGRL